MGKASEPNTASLVSRIIGTWHRGEQPDAAGVLARYPALRADKSLAIQLAYEAYCLRREAGEAVFASAYCEQFPSYRRSLRRLISVHQCLDEDPGLVDAVEGGSWPEADTEFLGFQLVGELGRGAFARVYLATEPSLGNRPVVVKISPQGGGEAETLGRLAHRNIVPVHSVRRDERAGLTAVCMPYLGSATLLTALDVGFASGNPPRRAALIPRVAHQEAIVEAVPETFTRCDPLLARASYVDGVVHLIAQLADALAHAHQCGICHRDLKPSNILLTPSGCPMLLDFNLSSDTRLSNNLIGGTLPYMPPELLRALCPDQHDPAGVDPPCVEVEDVSGAGDPRSDLYALGVILYESLTGTLPFGDQWSDEPASAAAGGLLARQQQGYVPVPHRNRHVNRGLAAIIDQCLAGELDQRPASASDLASALRAQLAPAARVARWAQRRKLLLRTGGLAVTVLAGGTLAVILSRPEPALRWYQAGIAAFDAGEYSEAVDHFTRARAARPDEILLWFARGQALAALEDFTVASADFRQIYDTAPSGPAAAWLAYCMLRAESDVFAASYYDKAVEEHDYGTVDVWNNRGYLARQRNSLGLSAKYLTQAIAVDPNCQTAYHNRAVTYFNRGKAVSPQGVTYGELAVDDVERAIALGPADGELLSQAALTLWRHSTASDVRERVVQYLCQAVDVGFDREKILADSECDQSIRDEVARHAPSNRVVPPNPLYLAPPYTFPPLPAR